LPRPTARLQPARWQRTQRVRYCSIWGWTPALPCPRFPARAGCRQSRAQRIEEGGRLRQFRSQGLQGTPYYVHEDGRRVTPGAQLQLAIRQIGFLEAQYPAVLAALRREAPGSGAADIQRADFWLEVPFADVTVLSLASEMRHAAADRALAADLHFYASRGYNAMLTVVGVVPYKTGGLVFAITHLFTARCWVTPARSSAQQPETRLARSWCLIWPPCAPRCPDRHP
jgi:hypothetical protein